jgi:hypothetical protein
MTDLDSRRRATAIDPSYVKEWEVVTGGPLDPNRKPKVQTGG